MALPEVDFLTWAIGAGANVETQADYAADGAQAVGVVGGLARSSLFNKVWRQTAFVTSTMATLMAAVTSNAQVDDGDQNEFWKDMWETLLGASYFIDTGTAAAWLAAAPYGLVFDAPFAGLKISLKVAHTSTGPVTLAWAGNVAAPVIYADGSAIKSGDITANGIVDLVYDGTHWQMISLTAGTPGNAADVVFYIYAGNPNGHVAGQSTAPQSYCWDSTDLILYACDGTGSTSTATWVPVIPTINFSSSSSRIYLTPNSPSFSGTSG